MLRKAMSAVAVLTMALGVAVVSSTASSAAVDGDLVFTCSGGNATITDYTGSGGNLVIPDELLDGSTDCTVTGIGSNALKAKGLTGVSLPDSLTVIGQQAFMGNALTSVSIPDSVTSIGVNAFRDNSLTTAAIGNAVTNVPYAAFAYNSLTSVSFGDSVTSIADFAFAYNAIESVAIPDTVTSIGNYAFIDNALTTVTIPSGVTTVRNYAFAENNLTSVSMPDTVTWIGEYAFSDNSLTSVTIPGAVTTIDNAAFFKNALTSVVIPASVTTIDPSAFQSNNLSSVTFMGPVAAVAANAFNSQSGASGVSRWYTTYGGASVTSTVPASVPAAVTYYASAAALPTHTVTFDSNGGSNVADQTVVDGWIAQEPPAPTRADYTFAGWFDTNGDEWDFSTTLTEDATLTAAWNSNQFVATCNSSGDATITEYTGSNSVVDIPEHLTVGTKNCTVTIIGGDAFSAENLTGVTIPNSVTDIGIFAFYGNALTNVTIPDSVTSIGDYAFYFNSLNDAVIGRSVTTIGYGAFKDNSLTSVTIPDSVTSIGDKAFEDNALTNVVFTGPIDAIGTNAFIGQSGASGSGIWYTVATGSDPVVGIPTMIPAAVTYYSSVDALPIQSVTFDSNGGSAVTTQTLITGEAAVKPVDPTRADYTFAGWFDTNGDEWDFSTTLTEDATLSAAWTSNLFSAACDAEGNATITHYDGPDGVGVDVPAEITIGLDTCTVTALGDSSFWGNHITAVTLPDTLTTIGKDALYVNDIASVTIPDSVTSIGYAAFAYNNLTSVTVPDSITEIEDFVFNSNSLESFSLPDSVTSIGVGAFGTNNLTEITIPASVAFIDSKAFSTNFITHVTFEGAGATVAPDAFSIQSGNGNTAYWYTVATGGAATEYIPSPVPAAATYTTQPNGFVVTFDSDGGTATGDQYVVEGDGATEPADPFLPGHTFTGWVDGDDAAWDFATLVTEDMTLTATYSVNTPAFWVPTSAHQGDTITITGSGFDPGEQVTVELHSSPVTLGTVTANAAGNISGAVVIPADTEVGEHTIVVVSAAGTFTSPITVTAADPAPSESPSPSVTPSEAPSATPTPAATATPVATGGDLSATGPSFNLQVALIAVLVLLNAGMALVIVNGRRAS
jgi:uncharacterized repeat protein (TIGR02543 family)